MQELVEGEVGIIGETIPRVLGDIVISLDQAKVQAKEYGHSPEREVGFLIIHGLLHLLGYDHMNEEQEEVMFKKQNELLGRFGLARYSSFYWLFICVGWFKNNCKNRIELLIPSHPNRDCHLFWICI